MKEHLKKIMKSIISITILTLMFSMNAQDLNTSVNSINMNNWMNIPHVKGRYATLEDVKNGRAIYRSDEKVKYIPVDLEIPFLALLEDPMTEIKDTIVVIQANKFKDGIYLGYKLFHNGGSGTSLLKDLTIIDNEKKTKTVTEPNEKKKEISDNLDSQNNENNKINIIIPNCGIDSQWHRLKYQLNEEYWAVYEQINDHYGGNFLIKKYDPNRSTIPDFLVKGLNLKDSLFTNGIMLDRMLYLGESIRFTVYNKEDERNSKDYFIYAKGNLIETKNNEFPYFNKIENYELVIDSYKDKVGQTIRKMDLFAFPSGGFEGGVYIHWIGDLNGDNLLDMLVGISEHYAGAMLSLFLSDNNSKQLFKEHIAGGCSYD